MQKIPTKSNLKTRYIPPVLAVSAENVHEYTPTSKLFAVMCLILAQSSHISWFQSFSSSLPYLGTLSTNRHTHVTHPYNLCLLLYFWSNRSQHRFVPLNCTYENTSCQITFRVLYVLSYSQANIVLRIFVL